MSVLEFGIHKLREINDKIIVDVDDNFWTIPKTHIAYDLVGPNSGNVRSLERIIKLAKTVVTSTVPLAEYMIYKNIHSSPIVNPNVCNSHNKYNEFSRPSKYLRYGFSGTMTHREDFKTIFKPLKQFIMEHNNVQIAIAVDPEIYRMFRDVPEERKLFVPAYNYEEYPLQLSYFDVMLIPLINDEFNQSKSDIKILDALINGKPFIASDVYPYSPYGKMEESKWAGLVIKNDENSWYSALCYMLSEKNRDTFSINGKIEARNHDVKYSSQFWKKLILGIAK